MYLANLFPLKPPPTADHSGSGNRCQLAGRQHYAMPALQSFHRRHPHTRLAMVVRPHLVPLWQMHPAVDVVMPCSARCLNSSS